MATLSLERIVSLENEPLFEAVDLVDDISTAGEYYLLARFYCEMEDTEQLRFLFEEEHTDGFIPPKWLSLLVKLMTFNLEGNSEAKDLAIHMVELSHSVKEGLWKAEIHRVLGQTYENCGELFNAYVHYKKSYEFYSQRMLSKKAFEVQFQYLRMEKKLYPRRSLVERFRVIHDDALSAQEFTFAGKALLGVSSEYYQNGNLRGSEDSVDEALFYLRDVDLKSVEYVESLIQKIILLKLRSEDLMAQRVVEELRRSDVYHSQKDIIEHWLTEALSKELPGFSPLS